MTSLRVALVLVGVACASPAFATGQCDPEPIEQHTGHPDELPAFAAGRLGLVYPRFARMYLARTYLALTKKPLAASVQKELVDFWQRRYFISPQGTTTSSITDPREAWEAARKKAFTATPKLAPGALGDSYRPNCMDHAFSTAVATLARLSRPDGLSNTERFEWLKAQDQVFSNCMPDSSPSIPPPLASGTSMALSERRYQIAAASFYAGKYDDAAKVFTALSKDKDSPWAAWADYLRARALVRGALAGTDNTENTTLTAARVDPDLARADKLLVEVVAKGGPQAVAAQRLLGFIHVRTQPLQHLRASAALLASGGTLYVDALSDWVVGLDHMLGEENAADVPMAVTADQLESVRANDELTDWVLSFGTTSKQLFESTTGTEQAHALERWRTLHTEPWLLAALAHAAPADREAPALLTAARAIPRDSPAYDTAFYFASKLAVAAGKNLPELRKRLDDEIDRRTKHPRSSLRNALLDLRASIAPNIDEVLASSLRARMSEDDCAGLSAEVVKPTASFTSQVSPGIAFAIERNVPLAKIEALSSDARLPELLRDQMRAMAWSRALVLGNLASAERLLPQVRAHFANATADQQRALESLAQPTEADEHRLRAALALISLRDVIDPGSLVGATSCPSDEARPPAGIDPAPLVVSPNLFATADRKAREHELHELVVEGSSFDIAVGWVLAFAKAHPTDPRMPQLLYDINQITHRFHACKASQSSKAAYLLMHKLYGKHPLSKKVKYWW